MEYNDNVILATLRHRFITNWSVNSDYLSYMDYLFDIFGMTYMVHNI